MIKAIIIDDEEHSRTALKIMLNQFFPEITISGEAHNMQTGIEAINRLDPSIIFLDIQMPDGSGFDLLNQIRIFNFEVIFTTAFSEYAYEAFQVPAIGYLLKPLSDDQFKTTVQRAIRIIQERKESILPNDQNANTDARISKILINNADGFIVVPLKEIIHFEGDRNYTKVYLQNKEPILSSHHLGWFEKLLANNPEFFRVSKSHIINLDHVRGYSRDTGGLIIMSDFSKVYLSTGRKEKLRDLLLRS